MSSVFPTAPSDHRFAMHDSDIDSDKRDSESERRDSERVDTDLVWEFKKCIPSSTEAVAEVIGEVVHQLERHDWPERDAFGVHMATEEALMNAVKHGNGFDESKSIRVEIELSNNRFAAKIVDEGTGFDPNRVPDPCDDKNLDKTSGRGVSLIKSFVDEVKYNEKGNSIEFSKSRNEQVE